MKEKAVIYTRYSSEKQTEQSIEGQTHVCQEYAAAHNLQVVKIYIDRAKSGRNDNRDDFQKMLADSEKGNFSYVIVYAFDRFARNRFDSAINKARLKKNGVKLISATQAISDSPEGILLESLLEGLDEYYSAELSQKLRRGRKESIEKGQYVGGLIPYGYSVDKNKKYLINTEEVENVKLIFSSFPKFMRITPLVNFLREENVYNRSGCFFTNRQIESIFNNPIYKGDLKSGELYCKNCVPAIISPEAFNAIQEILNNSITSYSKSSADFLLSGKLVCGECGANIVGESGTSKTGKTYFYYNCRNRKNGNKCNLVKIPKDKLEDIVYQKARTEILKPDVLSTIANKITEIIQSNRIDIKIENIKKQLVSIDRKINNLVNAIQQGIINEKIKQQNIKLLGLKDELEKKLDVIIKSPIFSLTSEKIKEYIKNCYSHSTKKELIESLIYKVEIFNDKFKIIFNLCSPNPKIRRTIEFEQITFGGSPGIRTRDPLIKSQVL